MTLYVNIMAEIRLDGDELITRVVKNNGRINIPSKYAGQTVTVVIPKPLVRAVEGDRY